jgi:ATP synthase I chain
VGELRRFELMTAAVLLAFLSIVGVAMLAVGHPRAIAGLVAGGLLGLANMVWMVGTARSFLGHAPTARMLQLAAAIRFLTIAVLLGVVLIVSRVDPVGAAIGYFCFPIAGAVAGWQMMRARPGVPV